MFGRIDPAQLDRVVDLQKQFAALHPALECCYPVAIVQDDTFQIYDLDESGDHYHFVQSAPTPMPVPQGVRAAFPLEAYDGRIACVVTPEVFDEPGGLVTILHEFVHCYQFSTCEMDLKAKLAVARQAEAEGDMMWELQHPFPYEDQDFILPFKNFIMMADVGYLGLADRFQHQLKTNLSKLDYEYMVWQEWKEGFARHIENRLQIELGLPVNLGGGKQPFSRVSFYAAGAAYIDMIAEESPEVVEDLPALFDRMMEPA
ncbi:hypothetical protein KQH50_00925 [bacterium]|nr:hypothetical protein [bacterium]